LIQVLEVRLAAGHQLVKELGVVLPPPFSLDLHGEAFIEPPRDGSARSTRYEYMRDLMAQDVFESAVGISRRTGWEQDNQVRLAYCEA
jgi:hypothetical protein